MMTLIHCCDVFNRVISAYFMNIAEEYGVNFEESKPQVKPIADLNKGFYFTEDTNMQWMKSFYHCRIVFENVDLEKLKTQSIEDFFDDDMKGIIHDNARHFARHVKENSPCDFIFSEMTHGDPFIYSISNDPETNFKSRLMIGKSFLEDNMRGLFEFYCILMQKVKEDDGKFIPLTESNCDGKTN